MTAVSASFKPNKRLKNNLKAFKDGPIELLKKMDAAALVIDENAKRNLQARSIGETVIRYSKPKGKRSIMVSSPGDPPNSDTFTAMKSIKIFKKKLTWFIGTKLGYLAGLEFDSRSSKRAARPWLKPAFEKFIKKHGTTFFKFTFPKVKK